MQESPNFLVSVLQSFNWFTPNRRIYPDKWLNITRVHSSRRTYLPFDESLVCLFLWSFSRTFFHIPGRCVHVIVSPDPVSRFHRLFVAKSHLFLILAKSHIFRILVIFHLFLIQTTRRLIGVKRSAVLVSCLSFLLTLSRKLIFTIFLNHDEELHPCWCLRGDGHLTGIVWKLSSPGSRISNVKMAMFKFNYHLTILLCTSSTSWLVVPSLFSPTTRYLRKLSGKTCRIMRFVSRTPSPRSCNQEMMIGYYRNKEKV